MNLVERLITLLSRAVKSDSLLSLEYSDQLDKLVRREIFLRHVKTQVPIYCQRGINNWTFNCSNVTLTLTLHSETWSLQGPATYTEVRPSYTTLKILEDIACGKEYTKQLQTADAEGILV